MLNLTRPLSTCETEKVQMRTEKTGAIQVEYSPLSVDRALASSR
jgi:hypothetical protein